MRTPRAAMLRVLNELPENVLLAESVLRVRVLDKFPRPLTGSELDQALADVHRHVGLVAGIMGRGDQTEWGLALRRKITAMPAEAIVLIGAEIPTEATS